MPAETVPEVPVTTGLLDALLAVQAEAPTLRKDARNPHFGSSYTPLDTIVETIGPILNRHGLVWMTFPGRDDHGDPALHYELVHASTGEARAGTMPLLLTKPDPQGMGSAVTYARRYSLCAVLNLVADDDDDGNAAATRGGDSSIPASVAQRNLIERLVKEKGATKDQLSVMLRDVGASDVEVLHGWTGKLTGGREGTASALITWLKEKPLPDPEHQSDLPDDTDGFEHPPADPVDLFPPEDAA